MSAAPGIQMWTNHLLHANAVADSGLREDPFTSPAPRPMWNVFASFPAYR
jgi:hypothetical protein